MKTAILAGVAALALSAGATAGGATIADRCIAHVSKGAITVFRDVDVLASGRDRIAYFRCIRNGIRDDASMSAFAGLVPYVATGFGGGGSGFSGVTLSF
jgi:hypothetical protein